MSYHGAGILFFRQSSDHPVSILLGQRRYSGVWSIPGGGRASKDPDSWATARRETHEEFGFMPETHQQRFTLKYPFGLLGFDWTTFVVELPAHPSNPTFPDRTARDFHAEFRDADWFPIHALPAKTHWLLYPAVWRLQLGVGIGKNRNSSL